MFQRNRALPQLDFQLRYGYNGLGGDVIMRGNFFDPDFDPTLPPVVIPGGYGDALEQIFDYTFRGWSTGLVLGVPIQNREGPFGTCTRAPFSR